MPSHFVKYYCVGECLCLHVYLQDVFNNNPNIVCVLLSVCVLGFLTRTNGYSAILSCSIQGVALSAWDSQCDSDLGTATKLGHHTGKIDDFVQPQNMKFFPLYMCVRVCVWERIILVELPRLK